ncbi:kinase-like domain-containing protein [Tribonema minus]|uniref:Kinase-like domain-containing protein n=1 Tax=Tribonema minus TaxID=303371 RepID=A0A835Z8Z5_9STRA|nr:kinase-like domain-containing protein [Tribonema minus]
MKKPKLQSAADAKTSPEITIESCRRERAASEVQWNELQNLRYVGRGAMCRIYSANLGGRKVAVKIARDDCKDPSAAEHDLEYRFLVLEYLELGTLADGIETGVMQGHQQSTLAKLVKGAKRNKHSQFVIMLERALEMAEAMEYMHYGLCGGATVVLHRDLKPDNVGFAADGTLKLFDFGLARCQRRAENNTARYSMTGNTGTVRYMPPEVARGQCYNEKVDVYSFGLMLWEMLQYRRVFSGISVREFYADVLVGGRRPTPDPSWSPELVALMKGCWSVDCNKRPCFKSIVATLRSVLAQSLPLDVTRAPTAISLVSSDAQEVEVASPSHASSGRYSTGMLGQLRRRMSFAVTSKRSLQRQSAGLR